MRTPLSVAGVVAVAFLGCKGMEVLTQVGVATGHLNQGQAQSIQRAGTAVEKTFQDINPEQEYYVGRSVAATILARYRPYDAAAANRYLNLVGQTLAAFSDRPETFGGYHFQVLDTEEVNAFAAPGGLILVSRGMLRCCKSEDELAAVLAHEIAHVRGRHGLQAIKKGRLTSALLILAAEGAKNLGGENLAQVTQAFEGSITDITTTLTNSGYARDLERQADREAVAILARVGYDPEALVKVLGAMKSHLKPGGQDFAKTHPDPEDRIRDVRDLARPGAAPAPAARQKRFEQAIGNL